MNGRQASQTPPHLPFAIAGERAREHPPCSLADPQHEQVDVGKEAAKAGVGVLMAAGALIGIGGVLCLGVGILHGRGLVGMLESWLTALGGR
ncbi:MAG: hypothetical protein ACOY3Z_08210 [Thermodesulfobacteriota bacterium]